MTFLTDLFQLSEETLRKVDAALNEQTQEEKDLLYFYDDLGLLQASVQEVSERLLDVREALNGLMDACDAITRAISTQSQLLHGAYYRNVLGEDRQELSYKIWAELIDASEAYFWNGITTWAGSSIAPDFTQEQIDAQFAKWNEYHKDGGAMNWGGNNLRDKYFDFESLPNGMKRAVCERVWAICKEAKLDEDPFYMESVAAMRNKQEIALDKDAEVL